MAYRAEERSMAAKKEEKIEKMKAAKAEYDPSANNNNGGLLCHHVYGNGSQQQLNRNVMSF